MGYRLKTRMSIGWIYQIGIYSSYILLFLEFELRRMLRQGGDEIWGIPYFTILLVALMFIVLGIIQWFRYRNWIYPVLGFIMGITIAEAPFIFHHYDDPGICKLTCFPSFILIILFSIINCNSFSGHKTKWMRQLPYSGYQLKNFPCHYRLMTALQKHTLLKEEKKLALKYFKIAVKLNPDYEYGER